MDNNENFFVKHKFLVITLLVFYILFIACYYMSGMGLFFDIPAMFTTILSHHDNSSFDFIVFIDERVRQANNYLVALPFNVWFNFFRKYDAFEALKVFSSSYFIIHFFALCVNYFVARRTKRYDIAVIAFAFYFLLSVPNAIWSVRELHITFLLYFAVLSYFLSKEQLNWKDLIPIILLLLYLFESFETTIIFGAILFIASQLYVKRANEEDNLWHKALIGLLGGLTCLYIPIRMILIALKGGLSFSQGATEWLTAIKVTFQLIVNTSSLLVCFSILAVIFCFFYKKQFTSKSFIFIIPIILAEIFIIYKLTDFYPSPKTDLLNYSFAMVSIFPILAVIIIFDYFKMKKQLFSEIVSNNLVIVTCIYGILTLISQIYFCYNFDNYISYLENLLNKSEETIVNIPQEDFDKYPFLQYETCYGAATKSLYVSNNHVIDKVILPTNYYQDYSEFCFEGKEDTYYDKEADLLILQHAHVKPQTRFWDVSPLIDKFIETDRTKN